MHPIETLWAASTHPVNAPWDVSQPPTRFQVCKDSAQPPLSVPIAPHLDLTECVKAVHLVEQLQHGALDLTLTARVAVVTLGADRINLVCTGAGSQQQGSSASAVGFEEAQEAGSYARQHSAACVPQGLGVTSRLPETRHACSAMLVLWSLLAATPIAVIHTHISPHSHLHLPLYPGRQLSA